MLSDSLIVLKAMMDNKYKDFDDDVYDAYYDAWIMYSDILYERKNIINDTSMRLIVRSFNRDEEDELYNMLKEAVCLWLENYGKLDKFVEEFIKNSNGYFESLGVLDLYSSDGDKKENVRDCLRNLPDVYKQKIANCIDKYKFDYIKDIDLM